MVQSIPWIVSFYRACNHSSLGYLKSNRICSNTAKDLSGRTHFKCPRNGDQKRTRQQNYGHNQTDHYLFGNGQAKLTLTIFSEFRLAEHSADTPINASITVIPVTKQIVSKSDIKNIVHWVCRKMTRI